MFRNKLKEQEQVSSVSQNPLKIIVQKTLQKNSTISENNDTNIISRYFKQDFTKSLFLIAGIITLELIFYFVSMNSNLRSIFKFIP